MKSSLLMHKHIIALIYSYKTFALFTRGLFSCSLQSKECLNKPNLPQRKLGKFARNIRMSFRQLLPATCNATFATCKSNATKSFLLKATEKVSNTKENWRRSANLKVSKPLYNSIKQTSRNRLSLHFNPLHKFNHPSLKSLFATIGKVLP